MENDTRSSERGTYDKMFPNRADRICTARCTSGKPCERYAVRGAMVCPAHGGNLPTTRAAARRKLMEYVEPIIARLSEIALDPLTEDADAIKAGIAVLDRAGFGPSATLNVNEKKRDDLAALTDEQLAARAQEIARRVQLNAASQRESEQSTALVPIDAEVVDSHVTH